MFLGKYCELVRDLGVFVDDVCGFVGIVGHVKERQLDVGVFVASGLAVVPYLGEGSVFVWKMQLPFAVTADDSVEIARCRNGVVLVWIRCVRVASDDVQNVDAVDFVVRKVGACERGKRRKEVDGAEGLVGNAACRS